MSRRSSLAVFVMIACLSWQVSSGAAQEKFRIGVLAPLTGAFARYGDLIRQGVSAGAGPEVEFVFEDDGCEPAKAVSAFLKLRDLQHIQFFIGPGCGSPQQAIAPLLKNREQLLMLPCSAAAALHETSGGRVFSAQYAIEDESRFNAEQVFQRNQRTVVIVFNENEFSRAHERSFRQHFPGRVLATVAFPVIDEAQVQAAVLKVKALKPDAVYVPDAGPFFGRFLTMLDNLGLRRPVYSVYSAQIEDLLAAEGPHAEGLIYSYPVIGDQEALTYFPRRAAQILSEKVKECGGRFACVEQSFNSDATFDTAGVLRSRVMLKTVRSGKFVPLE